MTLEGNVWVGEMYEGQDILYQVNCSGDSIAPALEMTPVLVTDYLESSLISKKI